MQDGNPGQDPVCGRCKQKVDMAVRTEAVYQEGMWFHTACHWAGADQLFRATRLAEVLKDIKRGVEILTSPLLQGDASPVEKVDEEKPYSLLTPSALTSESGRLWLWSPPASGWSPPRRRPSVGRWRAPPGRSSGG
jgi:hypothetical protein